MPAEQQQSPLPLGQQAADGDEAQMTQEEKEGETQRSVRIQAETA